jgi:hypothetical protein
VVLTALGIKKTLGDIDTPLDDVVAVALCAGLAAFFAALTAITLRRGDRLAPEQPLAVAAALVMIPVAMNVDAVWSLATLAAVSLAVAWTGHRRAFGPGPRTAGPSTAGA